MTNEIVAVIDIGSNSVRCSMHSDGKTFYKELITTRLGKNLTETGVLAAESVEASVAAIGFFILEANKNNASRVFCFTTEAVRRAKNGSDFTKIIKEKFGIEVDVITGETEAAVGVLGALGRADGGVIDVGGASTEIVIQKDNKLVYKRSFKLGAVTLSEIAKTKNYREVAENVRKTLDFNEELPICPSWTAIGGTATAITSMLLKLKVYDKNLTHGSKIKKNDLHELNEKLKTLSQTEMIDNYCISALRAEIIVQGGALFEAIMDKIKADEIIVSENDNLEGYYLLKTERKR